MHRVIATRNLWEMTFLLLPVVERLTISPTSSLGSVFLKHAETPKRLAQLLR
jgi:hypothetical protein